MHVIQWQRQYPLDRKAGRCHERIRTNSSESGASSPRAVWYRSCSGQKNRYTHSLARRGGSQRRTICWNCIDFSLALGLYKTSDRPQNCLYWRSESHGSVTCHRGLKRKSFSRLICRSQDSIFTTRQSKRCRRITKYRSKRLKNPPKNTHRRNHRHSIQKEQNKKAF